MPNALSNNDLCLKRRNLELLYVSHIIGMLAHIKWMFRNDREATFNENFDVSSEGTSLGSSSRQSNLPSPDEGCSLETPKFSLYFSGSCIPNNPKLSYYWHCLRWHKQFKRIFQVPFRFCNSCRQLPQKLSDDQGTSRGNSSWLIKQFYIIPYWILIV